MSEFSAASDFLAGDEGRKRLFDMLMHAPVAVAILAGYDLRVQLANPLYRELLGVDRLVEGEPLQQAVPDISPELMKVMRDTSMGGKPFSASELPVTLDWAGKGRTYTRYFDIIYEPLKDSSGKPEGVAVFAYEVTEKVQARQQIAQQEEEFRFMAESMPQKIFTMSAEGIISYYNPQWESYTGIGIDVLLSHKTPRRDLIHIDDRGKARRMWRSTLQSGKPSEFEFRMQRHDGEFRWHLGRLQPMFDKDGAVTMWVGSLTDIEDSKRAAQRRHELEIETAALAEQQVQLLSLNQAKDEFISLASHQLRTPATGVKQYLGMMLEGYAGKLNKNQTAFLETAYESNERQINIVNDLLQVARIDAGKVKLRHHPIDVVKLLKNVINEHTSRFAERQQSIVLRAKDKVIASVDGDKIRMVFDNIIDNASKYTSNGKRITVTVRCRTGKAEVAIADQGVGMDLADTEKIFQKFSRLENPYTKAVEGSGLGLYWAKKIVDLHGGGIKVKSIVGKGTTFTVILPVLKG